MGLVTALVVVVVCLALLALPVLARRRAAQRNVEGEPSAAPVDLWKAIDKGEDPTL